MRLHAFVCLLVLLPAACASTPGLATTGACNGALRDVDGQSVWVDTHAAGEVTVAFESGNGNDSSVWSNVATRVRESGLGTFVYDRPGLGKSPLRPGPYAIENEVRTFGAALTACDIHRPVVLVAHSYGGVIALLLAARDHRIVGLVLVEALVPHTVPKSETDAILAKYRPQYNEVRREAPQLAAAIIPLMEAFPETARALDAVALPNGLPVIDIVAEHPEENSPQSISIWRRAHAEYVHADPAAREAVFASGSTHKVMDDRPDLVVAAILRMAARSMLK